MAEKQKVKLKRWSIWFDPQLSDYYVILRVYKDTVRILWLYSDLQPYTINIRGCDGDEYVRTLTPLEKELL